MNISRNMGSTKKDGMTLMEIMFVMAIITLVMGILFSIAMSFMSAVEMQDMKISLNLEVRRAFQVMSPALRQASRKSVVRENLPGDRITFMMAADVSGNGSAVDVGGFLELIGPVTIQRDRDDLNQDGFTMTQLVMVIGEKVRVLANDLLPGEAPADAVDRIPDNVGFWVVPRNGGYDITVRVQRKSGRGRLMTNELSEYIRPRNV